MDEKTLEKILKNIREIDDAYIKLSNGELKMDREYRITDTEGKIDEKYMHIMNESIRLRAEHLEYKILYGRYIEEQVLLDPHTQVKKMLYLEDMAKKIEEE